MDYKHFFRLECICPIVFTVPASASEALHDNEVTDTNEVGKEQPNVIFILADDMGYGELSCFNVSTPAQTPNIDRIAQAGVKMTQAYAYPVSSPTRSCFLTGQFPQHVGVYRNFDGTTPGIGPFRHCFSEDMITEGYQTAWFGKWHQGWDIANHPANNGFERAYGFLGGMHDYYDSYEGDHYVGGPFAKHAWVFDQFKPVPKINYLTEELTDQFLHFLDNRDSNKPFFSYMAYNAPHTPLQAPEKYVMKYINKGFNPVLATRYAMVDVLDVQVGRILDKLKEMHIEKETLVIFMTDNGPESEKMSGGLRGIKMTVWEGGIRVPMVASLPGVIPAGTESDAICSVVDMASTFLALAKGKEDFSYGDGHSLIPFFKGKKGNVHDQLVFTINPSCPMGTIPQPEQCGLFAVRDGDWKLVCDKHHKVNALYNLKTDKAEQHDLSAEHPEIKARLLEYGRNFLQHSQPACGPITNQNTRKGGDLIKINKLLDTYKEYVKGYKFTWYDEM